MIPIRITNRQATDLWQIIRQQILSTNPLFKNERNLLKAMVKQAGIET